MRNWNSSKSGKNDLNKRLGLRDDVGVYRVSITVPHSIPVKNCNGRLADPEESYGETAYWHANNVTGWFASPRDGVDYIPCESHIGSFFVVKRSDAVKYNLTEVTLRQYENML